MRRRVGSRPPRPAPVPDTLRLALQKSGRLAEQSLDLIAACGIALVRDRARLRTEAYNFPLEVLFLRDDDIPRYVADGVADLGLVGENVLAEEDADVEVLEKTGFGRCRLAVAVPQHAPYDGVASLAGQRIATSYPRLLGRFLAEKGVEADVHTISGSVEIAPSIGLADAVCDLVSTGSTLLSNGLREVEEVFRSEAVLVGRRGLDAERSAIRDRLLYRVRAVLRARTSKYIVLNLPNAAIPAVSRLLPGMKAPTVMPLAEEGWSSLHSVVREDDFWAVVEQLEAAGAEGVLVLPIEKMAVG